MMDQPLRALAAYGGTAVVQIVGTDAWPALRQALARWIGQGDEQRELWALRHLDDTASEFESAEATEGEQIRVRRARAEAARWQAVIERTFDELNDAERARAADDLSEILPEQLVRNNEAGTVEVHVEGQGSVASGNVYHGHIFGHTSPGPEIDPHDDWPQES
ncbi:hypothetical protein [Streptomyces sp. CB02959]|uniref:hypothetical protein n=1 Tax=Streptomyces sp. CB02959 TaxID=2020330 RepID=UPI000C2738AC|nr:hypothetical protein [Streptomyces sp. CB02959]PJN38308.1 hypothetical protein CG747_23850 [Streptomyces sp. CB02959]